MVGKHKARATRLDWRHNDNTGNDYAVVTFALPGGQTLDYYGYMTEKTRDRTVAALTTCGWDGEDDSTISANEVQVVVEEEIDRDGNPRLRIRWVNDLSGRGPGVVKVRKAASSDAVAQARALARARLFEGGATSVDTSPKKRADRDPF